MSARNASAAALVCVALACTARAGAQTDSAREHVPPAPPATHVHEMSYGEMAEMMGMDDRARFTKVMLDELEWRDGGDAFGWDAAVSHGGDVHKAWLVSEGERDDGTGHARTELLWDRVVSRWWSARVGARHDSGDGPSRDWVALGIAGVAPGFIELEATAYVGESGATALRVQADYDLLLTQRLVLHPEIEVNVYGRDDDDLEAGLRLRYEVRREVAPYLGLAFRRDFGIDDSEWRWLAGIRVWF